MYYSPLGEEKYHHFMTRSCTPSCSRPCLDTRNHTASVAVQRRVVIERRASEREPDCDGLASKDEPLETRKEVVGYIA